ncbi:signal peptidase I [Saccharothrix obliqua]|uniref:signal peptidase I n=1 Tax=Saccharothrix obliqua TaxID=2861747 RepID=UPI001C5F778D|nr:signal peptidase I [Saccharothrix obliqua]MBW4716686.1 signal peptidase I [Saccharothrix obliqua]
MAEPAHNSADDGQEPDAESTPDSASGARGRKKKKAPLWREILVLLATALVLTVLIQTFLARVYVIPSASMAQTLHGCTSPCFGDRVLVDKLVYDFSAIEPGEVVVFRGPPAWTANDFTSNRSENPVVRVLQSGLSLIGLAPPDERDFVKRVIAVGGQTVECCDERGRVVVDGKPLDEPYIYWQPGIGPEAQDSFEPVKVPEGHLWVMGDNRNNSTDSRRQGGGGVNGTISESDVIGKARAIVLPPSRWGGVGDHNPQVVALSAPAWQAGLPAGAGLAAAWPVLLLGRRLRARLTRASQTGSVR